MERQDDILGKGRANSFTKINYMNVWSEYEKFQVLTGMKLITENLRSELKNFKNPFISTKSETDPLLLLNLRREQNLKRAKVKTSVSVKMIKLEIYNYHDYSSQNLFPQIKKTQ